MEPLIQRLIHPGIPIAALIVGSCYILFSSLYDWRLAHELLTEFSIALIIFGALGLSLEPWMRKALARDVFRAAFGYPFPEDFKNEIAKISEGRVICTKHLMNVRIQKIDADSVRIILNVERHLKNIGNRPIQQHAMLEVDDWGFGERAQILKCAITNSRGTKTKEFNPQIIENNPEQPTIKAHSPPLWLLPKDTAILVYEYSAVKRKHDQFIEWWLSPTRNPEIRIIEKPLDMNVIAQFCGDVEPKRTYIPDRYELDGVFFPPAVMKVRWWPKSMDWPPKSDDVGVAAA
jgi:hypothetical protein